VPFTKHCYYYDHKQHKVPEELGTCGENEMCVNKNFGINLIIRNRSVDARIILKW